MYNKNLTTPCVFPRTGACDESTRVCTAITKKTLNFETNSTNMVTLPFYYHYFYHPFLLFLFFLLRFQIFSSNLTCIVKEISYTQVKSNQYDNIVSIFSSSLLYVLLKISFRFPSNNEQGNGDKLYVKTYKMKK